MSIKNEQPFNYFLDIFSNIAYHLDCQAEIEARGKDKMGQSKMNLDATLEFVNVMIAAKQRSELLLLEGVAVW